MTPAEIHVTLVHVPILGSIFGLALLIYALIRKSDEVRRIALSFFVLTGIVAVIAYFSGPGAEEIVEHLPDVTHEVIESHEEMGWLAFWVAVLNGLLALGALVTAGRARFNWMKAVNLGAGLITMLVLVYTAYLGGQISHPELRPEWQARTEAAPCPPGTATAADSTAECTVE